MMKAFKIGWSITTMVVDLGYRFHVPCIECRECAPEWVDRSKPWWYKWGNGYFEFPALKFDFLNKKEFNFKRSVSVAEFWQIKQRIEQAAGRPVNLVPGSSIGEVAGNALTRKLDDIVWGHGSCPQISRRACELLAREGINLLTAECSIRCRGKKIDSHLAVQVEPVALLTEENLNNLGIVHCPICDAFWPKPARAVRDPECFLINRAAWPKGQHLVMVQETLQVIASQEFMEAVKKHKLVDIKFEECGRYV